MRVLLRWQHVTPDSQLSGEAGLVSVIEQLQGFEAAAVTWEPDLLARRLRHYEPGWLDRLCHDGDVAWLRLTPGAREADAPAGAPSKVTPIPRWGRRRRSRRSCGTAARASPPTSSTPPAACPTTSSEGCGTAWRVGSSCATGSAPSGLASAASAVRRTGGACRGFGAVPAGARRRGGGPSYRKAATTWIATSSPRPSPSS